MNINSGDNLKKKFFIICLILLLLFLSGYLFIKHNEKEETELNQSTQQTEEKTDSEIENNEIIEENNKSKINIKENIILSIGSKKPTIFDFTNQDIEAEIKIYFNNQIINNKTLNKIGTYDVEILINNELYQSKITVIDTSTPSLILNKKEIYYGQSYKLNDFIKSCTDDSKEQCILSFENKKMSSYKKTGTYEIVITAKDQSGNETTQKTTLTIKQKKENTNNNNSSNNSESNTNGTKPPKNETEEVTVVKTETETIPTITTKYGVKITDTVIITYNIYSDGTKKETSRKKGKTTYDYSNYNATTNDLKEEAVALTNDNTTIANSILNYLNEYRTEVNVNQVSIDQTLTIAANIRALELAYSQQFSHTRPNGSKYHTVITEIGGSWSYVGENIASGYTSPKSVSEAWKKSEGHYANMIKPNYTKIGIGHVNVNGIDYWVQLFAN